MAGYPYEFEFRRGERLESPAGARFRMGVHDFSERYGRYSGGPSYDYEYTERTITHPYAPTGGSHGFTRPLDRPRRSSGRGTGYGFEAPARERRRARRRTGYGRSYRGRARGPSARPTARRRERPGGRGRRPGGRRRESRRPVRYTREAPGDWPRARP